MAEDYIIQLFNVSIQNYIIQYSNVSIQNFPAEYAAPPLCSLFSFSTACVYSLGSMKFVLQGTFCQRMELIDSSTFWVTPGKHCDNNSNDARWLVQRGSRISRNTGS